MSPNFLKEARTRAYTTSASPCQYYLTYRDYT